MKKIIFIIMILSVAAQASANYGINRYGIDRSGSSAYGIGMFGENDSSESLTQNMQFSGTNMQFSGTNMQYTN